MQEYSPARLATDLDTLRRAAGLSYRQLRRRSGCQLSTLNDVFTGRRFPQLDTVLAIARACNEEQEQWRARWLEADATQQAAAEQRALTRENQQLEPQSSTCDSAPTKATSADRPPRLSTPASSDIPGHLSQQMVAARLEWVFLTTQRRVAGIIGVITIPVALIFVLWPLDDETSSGAVAMPARPAVRHCAYVIKEPAAVYPAPNANAKPIKFKYLDDRIETVDRPHPPGWIVVRTPRDSPGFNWMQTTVLTAAATCTSPGLP